MSKVQKEIEIYPKQDLVLKIYKAIFTFFRHYSV